ncbi:hypothetical protein [Sphingomonas sp. 2378]
MTISPDRYSPYRDQCGAEMDEAAEGDGSTVIADGEAPEDA